MQQVQKSLSLLFACLFLSLSTSGALLAECALLRPHLGTAKIYNNYMFGERLGSRAGFAGDVNGDGYEDYLLAQSIDFANIVMSPTVSLYSGKTGSRLSLILPLSSDAMMADEVGTMGDLTGNGRDEFYVATNKEFTSGVSTGRVGVYSYSGGSAALLYTLTSNSGQSDRFGSSVTTVKDLNGDGVPDIVVGAPQGQVIYDCTPPGCPTNGRIYVFSGATGALLRSYQAPFIESSDFGTKVVSIGDITGDGFDEILVSDPSYHQNRGMAVILSSRLLYEQQDPVLQYFYGSENWDQVGREIALLGDITKNGRGEIAIASGHYLSQSDQATVYILGANSNGEFSIMYSLTESIETLFGRSIVPWGDINGDGNLDFAVSSPDQANATVTFFSGINGAVLGTLSAESENDYFGGVMATPRSARIPVSIAGIVSAPISVLGNDWTGFVDWVTQIHDFFDYRAGAAYLVAPKSSGSQSISWQLCQDPISGGGDGGGSSGGGGGSDGSAPGSPTISAEQVFQETIDGARELIRPARQTRRMRARRKALRALRPTLIELRNSVLQGQAPAGTFRNQRVVRRMMRGFRRGRNLKLAPQQRNAGWRLVRRSLNRLARP